MRALITLLLVAVAFPATAGSKWTHTSQEVVNGETRLLHIVRDDDDHYARWERNGVRYVTRDAAVLAEIEKALEPQRSYANAHRELGRKHRELGREHAALGREHARLGREHARASRVSDSELRQRDFERKQQELERKQQALERRQQQLEREQQRLEATQKKFERDHDRAIDAIFERAVRNGKARRD